MIQYLVNKDCSNCVFLAEQALKYNDAGSPSCGIHGVIHRIDLPMTFPAKDTNLQEDYKMLEHRVDRFETKDSGKRQEFSTGMVRDVQDDKPRYDLVDASLLKRWAELMGRGCKKYGENNWRKAQTQEELNRFAASLLRHTYQLLEGDRSEDHAAAVCFNVAGYEMVKAKIEAVNHQLDLHENA